MDRTTVELAKPIRNRLREMKNDRSQTYDETVDEMLSAFGYPDTSPSNMKYRFTDSSCIFHCEAEPSFPLTVYTSPYTKKESYLFTSQTDTLNDFLDDFAPIIRYYDGLKRDNRQRAGSFVINQSARNSDHTWFGLGFDNFLNNCSNQEERYAEVGGLKSTHHHEAAAYIYHGNGATLHIYGQPSRDGNHLKRVGVSLLTHGCPIRRDFMNLLEQIPLEMSGGVSWDPLVLDWWNGRTRYGPRGIPSALEKLDPKNGIPLTDDWDDTIGYVTSNPYYNKPERLLKELDCKDENGSIKDSFDESDLESLVGNFVSTEKVLLRSKAHKPTEDTYYEPERLTLGELPGMSGIGTGTTVNIKISPQGDYS